MSRRPKPITGGIAAATASPKTRRNGKGMAWTCADCRYWRPSYCAITCAGRERTAYACEYGSRAIRSDCVRGKSKRQEAKK